MYEYDDLNNITSIKEPGAIGVFYDELSEDEQELIVDPDVQQSFSYDQRSRLVQATYTNPDNTQLNYDYKYEYNRSDDRTKLTSILLKPINTMLIIAMY